MLTREEKDLQDLLGGVDFEKHNFSFGNIRSGFANLFHPAQVHKLIAAYPRMAPAQKEQVHQALFAHIANAGPSGIISNTHEGQMSHPSLIDTLKQESKGTLYIVVNRVTHLIAQDLPLPLFAANDVDSDWLSTLSKYLPSGVTVTHSISGGTLTITYTSGSNVDTITVKFAGVNSNYPNFLQQLKKGWFKTKMTQIVINDPSQSDQLNSNQWDKIIYYPMVSNLGGTNSNERYIRGGQNEYMQLHNMAHIIYKEQKIDASGSHVIMMNQQNTQINYNVEVSDVDPALKF
ncbi:MAG: hypothetical protein KGJ07_03685 [Patescibacteria group bacterium]|nr:hypothetical protein [Patescibacteria group bacterium]